jgi:hypothetical protein
LKRGLDGDKGYNNSFFLAKFEQEIGKENEFFGYLIAIFLKN